MALNRLPITPTLRYPPTPELPTMNDYGLVPIPQLGQGAIQDLYWTEDGRSIAYSTGYIDEQARSTRAWWRYELETDRVLALEPPFVISQQIWDDLGAVREGLLPSGSMSPSGQYLLYMCEPLDYPAGTTAKSWQFAPLEIWIARTDGSRAIKVVDWDASCQTLGEAVWFENETRVIFSCGYEGPYGLFVAATDGSQSLSLAELTGNTATQGWAGMALSPDESRLAFTDSGGTLQLVSLDGGQDHRLGFGLRPSWSLDGRLLYYLKGNDEMFGTIRGICKYDLDAQRESEVVTLPAHTADGREIRMLAGDGLFAISPQETALVFQSQGLWLVTWSRQSKS